MATWPCLRVYQWTGSQQTSQCVYSPRVVGIVAYCVAGTMTEEKKYEKVATKEADEIKNDEELVGLKPKMTLFNGITVIVGSIIGSGIFISPTGVLKDTGSVGMSLVVWVASGLFSMVGAYCYAELGCMITKTGADYAYIMVTFGPFLAFMRLWVECLIVRPCSQTIVALTFSVYVMKPFFPTCDPPDDSARLLAAVCICKCSCFCAKNDCRVCIQSIVQYCTLNSECSYYQYAK